MKSKGILTPGKWMSTECWHFVVPVYQRLFTWEKAQFERLLADLLKWQGEDTQSPVCPYYLGIATVVEEKKNAGTFILVDGQQRLTVIAILRALLGWGEGRNVREILSYEARPQDRKALDYIFTNGKGWMEAEEVPCSDMEKITNPNMRAFVEFILNRKNDWRRMSIALKTHLQLLISELPSAYIGDFRLQNEYFEKMNSAGKQLEQHEVLKVRLCSDALDLDKWNAVEDFSEAFNPRMAGDAREQEILLTAMETGKAFSQKTDLSKSGNMKEGKWAKALVDFPMFLLHVLKLLEPTGFDLPLDSHDLLRCFDLFSVSRWPVQRKTDYLSKMAAYRLFLDRWVIHRQIDDPAIDEQEDATSFCYWSSGKNDAKEIVFAEAEGEAKKSLKQVQMALYALGGDRQSWLVEAFQAFERNWNLTALQAELRRKLVVASGFQELTCYPQWPEDRLAYGENLRAPLICLDYFLWELANSTEQADEVLRNEVFGALSQEEQTAVKKYYPRKNNRSVEHFHPRTDDGNPSQAMWRDDRDKNLFGNLALISPGQNSKFGNLPVTGKWERLKELVARQSLESIKLLLMAKMCHGMDLEWIPDMAREHANQMLKVIRWGLARQA